MRARSPETKAFSWRERLAEVRSSGGLFDEADRERAKEWTTCAVGEWHRQLPELIRYDSYVAGLSDAGGIFRQIQAPIDQCLSNRGHWFYSAIARNDVDRAEQLLDEIDNRVLELKRGEDHTNA